MKPYYMVFSFRGPNTLFQGQQRIKRGREKTEERTQIEESSPKEITEQITEERTTRDADQRGSKDQSRGTRTAPRHNVRGSEYIVKRDCSDD
jgi:hypothetical protein